MRPISDSTAIMAENAILPQYFHVVSSICQKLLENECTCFSWLDLGCGKGQIASQLDLNLPSHLRKKLSYYGYDLSPENTKDAENKAKELELACYKFLHGDIRNFSAIEDIPNELNFISCINTIHELNIKDFPKVLFETYNRLSNNGALYLYDFEKLPSPELGAFSLRGEEVSKLIKTFFSAISSPYIPCIQRWRHKSCESWAVQLERKISPLTKDDLLAKKMEIEKSLNDVVNNILEIRLESCLKHLKSLTSSRTKEEEDSIIPTLYEFWATYCSKENRR